MNIYLIGYRCTGKSSVGKSLAEKMGWDFTDADAELVKQNHMSISDMVARHGWDYFREKERAVIRRLSKLNRYVIATGGGVILNHENIQYMKKSGTVVWLRAASETIRNRMLQDENTKTLRPALTSKELTIEIEETLLSRIPLYESAADFFVDTDTLNIDDVCSIIAQRKIYS